MAVLLVTGMSGAGTSTVLDALARRGHRTVDTDEPGWIHDVPRADALEEVVDAVLGAAVPRGADLTSDTAPDQLADR